MNARTEDEGGYAIANEDLEGLERQRLAEWESQIVAERQIQEEKLVMRDHLQQHHRREMALGPGLRPAAHDRRACASTADEAAALERRTPEERARDAAMVRRALADVQARTRRRDHPTPEERYLDAIAFAAATLRVMYPKGFPSEIKQYVALYEARRECLGRPVRMHEREALRTASQSIWLALRALDTRPASPTATTSVA